MYTKHIKLTAHMYLIVTLINYLLVYVFLSKASSNKELEGSKNLNVFASYECILF